jgi:succinyl-CoA synthetase beta subunit
MKCDTIANGVVSGCARGEALGAARRADEGNERRPRKKILAESGLPIISANNMAEAGERVVAAIKGK